MNLVLVTGSRTGFLAHHRDIVWDRLRILNATDIVLHGGAGQGADLWAKEWCEKHQRPQLIYPAPWKIKGKSAGHWRNGLMLGLEPMLVIAFWDGDSLGTHGMIRIANEAKVPVEMISI